MTQQREHRLLQLLLLSAPLAAATAGTAAAAAPLRVLSQLGQPLGTPAAPAAFPILWDIGGAGLKKKEVAELVKATPRVQLDKIFECPHPCGLLPSIPSGGPCDPATAEYGCNGALPQGPTFNMTLHLDTLQKTLDKSVPEEDDRWIDLDFESWEPLWDRTGAAYLLRQ